MVPYFRAGLENKEFCLWILQPSITRRDALKALGLGVPGLDRYLSEGSLELVSQDQWYTDGGKFELASVIERFREKTAAVISEGYVGLRANGSSAWLQRADSIAFSKYERKLDELIADEKMIVVCSFCLRETSSAQVLDAARTHQLTAALRDGSWEVIETHQAGRKRFFRRKARYGRCSIIPAPIGWRTLTRVNRRSWHRSSRAPQARRLLEGLE